MVVDELDKRILSVLLEDGRASCREIARILGVSPATVAKRLKKLENSGLVKGYTALLDLQELAARDSDGRDDGYIIT